MALIGAFSFIRAIALFHLTLAYFLFTSPSTISEQSVVIVLGEAMRLPRASVDNPSPISALLAILFAFLGLADFTAVSMAEPIAYAYWGAQLPTRLFFLFGLTAYTYLSPRSTPYPGYKFAQPSPGDHLKNGFVFTWAFLELVFWFLAYLSIRDERRQFGIRQLERRDHLD